jgi:hypothetical protein
MKKPGQPKKLKKLTFG